MSTPSAFTAHRAQVQTHRGVKAIQIGAGLGTLLLASTVAHADAVMPDEANCMGKTAGDRCDYEPWPRGDPIQPGVCQPDSGCHCPGLVPPDVDWDITCPPCVKCHPAPPAEEELPDAEADGDPTEPDGDPTEPPTEVDTLDTVDTPHPPQVGRERTGGCGGGFDPAWWLLMGAGLFAWLWAWRSLGTSSMSNPPPSPSDMSGKSR